MQKKVIVLLSLYSLCFIFLILLVLTFERHSMSITQSTFVACSLTHQVVFNIFIYFFAV